MMPEIVDPIMEDERSAKERKKIEICFQRSPTPFEWFALDALHQDLTTQSIKKNLEIPLSDTPTIVGRVGRNHSALVDIGDGWAISLKVNAEIFSKEAAPFSKTSCQVGSLLRDTFSLRARPLFLLNALQMGTLEDSSSSAQKNRNLLYKIVEGGAYYTHHTGLPTLGGRTYLDSSYKNISLASLFCVGAIRHEEVRPQVALTEKIQIFYVGARTGRERFHPIVPSSFTQQSNASKSRWAKPISNPYGGKLLQEACMGLLKHPEAFLDSYELGKGGLISASRAIASSGTCGLCLDLAKIPQREGGMSAEELLLSESQERMLLLVPQGQEATIHRLFSQWNLEAILLGFTTKEPILHLQQGRTTIAQIPTQALDSSAEKALGKAPTSHSSAAPCESQPLPFNGLEEPQDYKEALLQLLRSPALASKQWIYRHYDSTVGLGTVRPPGKGAGIFRLRVGEKWKYLAAKVHGSEPYGSLDSYQGALIAVAQGTRHLTMAGAVPLAMVHSLYPGDEMQGENFHRMAQGLAEGCRFFHIPQTESHVAFLPEEQAPPSLPTSILAMVGLLPDDSGGIPSFFQAPGDVLLLVGDWGWELAGSAYARNHYSSHTSPCPQLHLEQEKRLQDGVLGLIRVGAVRSAHAISSGGLAMALLESCLSSPHLLGADIHLPNHQRLDVTLFNESQSRALLSVPADKASTVEDILQTQRVPAHRLGVVTPGGNSGTLMLQGAGLTLSWKLKELEGIWANTLEKIIETPHAGN